MSTGTPETHELLIVSLTPQNAERGALWFSKHLAEIKKARAASPWWRDNAIFIEKDLVFKPSEFLRTLVDFGYDRAEEVVGRGIFSPRGGSIELWPINAERPYIVEFRGNVIAEIHPREEREERAKTPISHTSIEKLESGAFVVHVDHGIGIYRGTASPTSIQHPTGIPKATNTPHPKKIQLSSDRSIVVSFFIIEYAPARPGGVHDLLYVPTDQKNRLSPYVGFTTPTIHRLGGNVWFKTKRKAREDAEKLARQLLELYAKREIAERPPFGPDTHLEQKLRDTFPYQETEDQLQAEKEILKDLESRRPMDRLLVGDVGFGKTEIAIRAAFRAITAGKQVALLSPTTVLAAQHERTFRERFASLPVAVAALSRLTEPRHEKRIIKEIAEGKVDCVIGTHRLLSKDISFKNLGLIIIDEEQRFGVKQKERFKELRADLDILSLTATPIPRTLSLAVAKLRDLSIIKTPPPARLPVKTIVLPYSKKLIREAIAQELLRGGQIYFLHNRIDTIAHARNIIHSLKLHPAPRVELLHGRMPEKEIAQALENFVEKKADILLATTIIENGLDISSANTLIVEDATRLGLAQAHQLRGRIGRGKEQAFAYFLYRPRALRHAKPEQQNKKGRSRRNPERAWERLLALQEYADLGAGYDIAMRDLEIRGAGNILGKEQSGAINKIGFNLYCQMLSDAVEVLKNA